MCAWPEKPAAAAICFNDSEQLVMSARARCTRRAVTRPWAEQPKVLTTEAVQASDVVITMGCGDACPFFPGKRYEDWELDDPAGQGIEAVRPIRDEIRSRIETLTSELLGQDPALA